MAKMKIPLPSILSTAWSASEPWPVTVTRPPLHYQPLDQMLLVREKQLQQQEGDGIASDYLLPLSPIDLFEDLKTSQQQHQEVDVINNPFLRTAVGLLYLSRQGFADECHSLVTPLSWAGETLVGYGPPTPGTEAEIVSTYAHMFVHRYEGSTLGELSMTGYQNSMFWGKATANKVAKAARAAAKKAAASSAPESKTTTMVQPPCDRIRAEMEGLLKLREQEQPEGELIRISNGMELSQDAIDAGRQWFQEWIVSDLPEGGWEPRALNELCKQLETSGLQEKTDPIAEFGAVANQLECDVLIDFCFQQAGYDMVAAGALQKEQQQQQQKEATPGVAVNDYYDDDVLRAASHVSSAHISLFQQNGVNVIRNVLSDDEGDAAERQLAKTRAVACRLLGIPACSLAATSSSFDSNPTTTTTTTTGACVYFTTNQETVLGFDIGPCDVLVASSILVANVGSTIPWREVLVPCMADDEAAVYRDAFFGTRGETPTTVIQWSKGTIF